MIALLMTACNGLSTTNTNASNLQNNDIGENQQPSSVEPEYSDLWENEAVAESYNKNSEEQPFYIYHNDNGEVWISHSQEEEDEYQMMKAREAHYIAMEEQQKREAEEERRRNDFHNWENEDVRQFYAEFSAYNDDDAEDKHYFYKKVDDRYFYEINLGFDAYEVEIEYKLESKFYKVKGSNVFLEFIFEPFLSRWDEGVMDCSGGHGTFYKKP
ncbi:MAG: hypothetical protein K2M37_08195 [Muribaculaceae bacterium]|nr:hypothetical protein [Muribaculaceae bacterium]